ncbi:hypothetical protein [Streptomyces sp. NPDC088350]|uniref:hypothetical protein n=1 Tax=Streptomyces sp. NPDC088350 TaxID=3365854 RepID=UPI003821CD02
MAVEHSTAARGVNPPAVRHPAAGRSVVALDPAHGVHGAEADGIASGLAEARRPRRSRPGCRRLRTHRPGELVAVRIRSVLGTLDRVIAQAYAGGFRPPRDRIPPAL